MEREYQALIRDRENLKVQYDNIRRKQTTAGVAVSLEQEQKAERFTLIDPPRVPQSPQNPPFKMILFGFAISLFGGFGTVVVR